MTETNGWEDVFNFDEPEYVSLSQSVDEYIDFAQHPERRIYFDIPELDQPMRGVDRGEMCLIVGFAHNGKTVLALELLMANKGKPGVLFTPDETRTAVIAKLTASELGIPAVELEQRLYQNDAQAIEKMRGVAEAFANLTVVDDRVSIVAMERWMDTIADQTGNRPAYVVFDYADQLSEPVDTVTKIDMLKSFGKEHNVPLFVLHQASKTAGGGGKEIDIESAAYGGHSQATFLIGVRRKINYYKAMLKDLEEKIRTTTNEKQAQRYAEKQHEIRTELIPQHHDTITLSLPKNKRPPSIMVEGCDFRLDQRTGRIRPLVPGGNGNAGFGPGTELPADQDSDLFTEARRRRES